MKKYLALLLVLVMVLSLAACASKPAETTEPAPAETTDTTPTEETKDEEPAPAEETTTEEEPAEASEYAVAMITDYGDITDQSFNQTTYEACKAFCEDNGVEFSYFKPAGDNTADRVAMIEKAVDEGYNVIVMPGYAFGGYMAGYAAVKLGYKSLGFLGGMAVPAVIRYGYGFVQGVDAAAADLGLSDVTLNYVYGGQFFGDADITAVMDTWYANGTEVVFACGGGIYTSAVDAAKKAGGKVIGVDVDQAGVIAGYAGVDGLTVTSAMKGLYPATYDTLNDVINNGNWANYVGKITTLGLVSADDPEANYVQIPMGEGTQWSDSFTQDDYKAMVADMYSGKITVSNDISKAASDFATVITVDDQGAIKG